MPQRILVTGSEGFVGRRLCHHLAEAGHEVLGCDRQVPENAPERLTCDLAQPDAVDALLDWAGQIEAAIHLAAITFVPEAAEDPCGVIDINLKASVRLMTALRQRLPSARMLLVGSSEAYGPPERLPMDETHPMRPENPYAITKMAADLHAAYLHRTIGADIVRMRPFNHSGPGQSDRFVLSSFARQLAAIEAGAAPPILHVGNLDVARDFTHVDDIVRGYVLALEDGVAGEAYNLCSGHARSIREVLDALLALSTVPIAVEADPARMRRVDIPEVRGSHEKFTRATGWTPAIPFEVLLEQLLDHWRKTFQNR